MIAYCVMLFLLITGILFAHFQKSFLNFVSIFSFFWLGIVFLANLKLYDMMDYSDKPYYIIAVGLFGMITGYLIRYYVKMWRVVIGNFDTKYYSDYNEKIILVLSLICLAYYAYELLNVLRLLSSGTTYYYIRRMYQGYEKSTFFTSSIERYVSSYIAIPCAYILSSYIVVSLFKKNKDKKVLALASLATLLYLVVSGSRFILIQLLIGSAYLFAFLKREISNRVKKWIKRFGIAIVIGVIALTLLRENRTSSGARYDWTLLQSVYSYFSISIPLMDKWIGNIDTIGYRAYGLVFFRPVLSILSLLILHPLGINIDALDVAIDRINDVENFIQVFPRHQYNAFASMFYYFYMDFGWVGVFLGTTFWGWICANVFKQASKTPSDRNLAFVLIVMQAMFKSMVRWEFSSPSFFVACIVTFFIFKRNSSYRRN